MEKCIFFQCEYQSLDNIFQILLTNCVNIADLQEIFTILVEITRNKIG